MSIWRAPLLILGILIILLAAGALAAPWLIDFNRYKPQLEQWASSLAGRKVRIGGDVRLVLFPWPAATLRDVRVDGVAGGRFEHLVQVEEVRARLSLAALLAARLEVERITLLRPVLSLEHMGAGRGNWLPPGGKGAGMAVSPESIALDAIRIVDGKLRLADQRMRGTFVVSRLNARLQAPGLTGPWRLQGAWHALGRAWRGRLSTGAWERGKPLGISLRMEPPEGEAGQVLRLNGQVLMAGAPGRPEGPRLEGRLSVAPVMASGRGNPLDPLRQVELDGRLVLTPDAVELTKLRMTPRFPAVSPFQRLTGKARLEFGAVLGASISLRAPELTLNGRLERLLGAMDGVAAGGAHRGADRLAQLRRHLLALASSLTRLPPDMLLEVDAQVARLRAEGLVFSGVALSAEASSELLSVRHLRADVPGQGALSFRGNLLAGDMLQLTGELSLHAEDARALLFGVSPASRRLLAEAWHGRAGRLEMLATLDLTDYALRLVSRRLKLDDAALALDWRLQEPNKAGQGRDNVVRLRAGRLDLERHARGGTGALALARALRRGLAGAEGGLRLDVAVDMLRLAGLSWRGVELSLRRKAGELHLPTLKVADVAGLALRASGDFRQQRAGWRGRLRAGVKGEKAATLWQVAGRFAKLGALPAWLAKLGAVDAKLQLDMDASARKGQRIEAVLNGQLGPLRLALSAVGKGEAGASARAGADAANGKEETNGTGKEALDWRRLAWRLKGDARGDQAAALLALAGLDVALPDGPARLKLRAEGVPATGMKGVFEAALPGARANAQGTARLAAAESGKADEPAGDEALALAGAGRVSLALDDVAAWGRLAGVALPAATPLKGEAHVAFSPRRLLLSKMALRAADNGLTGKLTLTWPEAGAISGIEATAPKLTGEVIADRLDVPTVAAMLLSEPDNRQRLRRRVAGGWALDVVLRGRELALPWPGVSLPDGKILLRQDDEDAEALRVGLAAGQGKAALHADARLKREELGLAVQGSVDAMLPLEQVVRSADDSVRMQGAGALTLRAKGRAATLNGLALALRGDGGLTLQGAALRGMAPERLLAVARSIGTQAELERFDALARAALLQGAWALPENVELKLRLADGLLEALPRALPMPGPGRGQARLFGVLDVAARKLDVSAEFVAAGEDAPPAFSVNLAGEPGALALSTQWDALREWVQQRVIRRQEDEVKRLEERRRQLREQARLLEEKARREAAERQRQERMRQQAERLHEQLQEVLAGAWQQMRAQERRQGVGGAVGAAPGGGKPPASIEELIRQAQEDEQSGDAAGGAVKAGQAPLPEAARAAPRPFGGEPPRPKKRPAHKPRSAGKQASGKNGAGARRKPASHAAGGARKGARQGAAAKAGTRTGARPAARTGTAASGKAKAAAEPPGRERAATARKPRPGAGNQQAARRPRPATEGRNARQKPRAAARQQGSASRARRKVGNFNNGSSRAARARETVRRALSQPLTNWNRLAP